MNREPIFTQRARQAVRDGAETATGLAVVLGALAVVLAVLLMAVLARIAPYVVAAFAAIILARCTGVL